MSKAKSTGRSANAMAACFMKAGKFHHKCAPRGGAVNSSRDILNDNSEKPAFFEKEEQEYSEYLDY